jgi:uncharacterized protein YwqG
MDIFNGLPENANENSNAELQKLLEKIEVVPGLYLPAAFVPYWPEIEKTKLPFIAIDAVPNDDLRLEASKFGYLPILPVDFEYPQDAEGKFMYPLAQINCNELPALSGYPTTGFLQFYIAAEDDVYGLDFDDQQSQTHFRVLYFENNEVATHKTDLSFLQEVLLSDMIPIHRPHGLIFNLKEEYIGLGDVHGEKFNFPELNEKYPSFADELDEAIYETFKSEGHKIGGYAYFTQNDPRFYNKKLKEYILLLQIDTDDHILWGDAGVGNFFIHPDDLAKKDFSKVLYNWDCA